MSTKSSKSPSSSLSAGQLDATSARVNELLGSDGGYLSSRPQASGVAARRAAASGGGGAGAGDRGAGMGVGGDGIMLRPMGAAAATDGDATSALLVEELPTVVQDIEESYWDTPLYKMYYRRTLWLVGLLLLQSYASLILERFELLLKKHLVITLFLPMLIGAAGNASSQSAILVVRGLATGDIKRRNTWRLLVREYSLALVIGLTMMVVAYVRVWLFHSSEGNSAALAVSAATLALMLLAIGLGTLVPVGLEFAGTDPAHAGPIVAVLVDLCGVAIICSVCAQILGY